ncbi:hypothetical protein CHS0354_015466 [Potamilus streckersoni]|uniref:Uncharacterized protein n=1 Tax=Potamilus streckersoni TaxID=2493646 RepID=A0AAE0RQN8_9BIVA|nr:hypothetical protein CHS0354_015466 [Potamilus streckersoni]
MDDDEEVTLRMAANAARIKRTDDGGRRRARIVSTDTKEIQTDAVDITHSRKDLHNLSGTPTTMLCHTGLCLLVISVSFLHFVHVHGKTHSCYLFILGVLILSFAVQFGLVLVIIYMTTKETDYSVSSENQIDSIAAWTFDNLTYFMYSVMFLHVILLIIT